MIGWACFGALAAAWLGLVGSRALRLRRRHPRIGHLAPPLTLPAPAPPWRCVACAPPAICPREGCPECKRPAPTGYVDYATGVYHPPPWAREVPRPRPPVDRKD